MLLSPADSSILHVLYYFSRPSDALFEVCINLTIAFVWPLGYFQLCSMAHHMAPSEVTPSTCKVSLATKSACKLS